MGINFKENLVRLEQAAKIAQDLERVLTEPEHLISGTKAAASHAKESQVLLELAKLPIDRLKDATEETVRIETMRKYGFENVASIYNSSAIQLERIPLEDCIGSRCQKERTCRFLRGFLLRSVKEPS
jgi:hypothetical protein